MCTIAWRMPNIYFPQPNLPTNTRVCDLKGNVFLFMTVWLIQHQYPLYNRKWLIFGFCWLSQFTVRQQIILNHDSSFPRQTAHEWIDFTNYLNSLYEATMSNCACCFSPSSQETTNSCLEQCKFTDYSHPTWLSHTYINLIWVRTDALLSSYFFTKSSLTWAWCRLSIMSLALRISRK